MVVYSDLLSDDVLIKFYYLKTPAFWFTLNKNTLYRRNFSKTAIKGMRFNLIRVGGWRFLSSVLKFHCFLQVIRINVDGSFISLSGREVCFPLFHGLRNLSFITKELARAANEHKNETINDSPWLWKKGLCHYSCDCKFKIFWQDSLTFATLFIT